MKTRRTCLYLEPASDTYEEREFGEIGTHRKYERHEWQREVASFCKWLGEEGVVGMATGSNKMSIFPDLQIFMQSSDVDLRLSIQD